MKLFIKTEIIILLLYYIKSEVATTCWKMNRNVWNIINKHCKYMNNFIHLFLILLKNASIKLNNFSVKNNNRTAYNIKKRYYNNMINSKWETNLILFIHCSNKSLSQTLILVRKKFRKN